MRKPFDGDPDDNWVYRTTVTSTEKWAYKLTINPVPEPGGLVLGICGFVALVGFGWRRRVNERGYD
jgi:hypothetical protein